MIWAKLMSNSDLFNEKTLKRLSNNLEISLKQKNAGKEWLELLEGDQLGKEKENYLKFNRIIITQLLGYPDLSHEVENVEFSYSKENKSLLKIEVKGTETKDLFQNQAI